MCEVFSFISFGYNYIWYALYEEVTFTKDCTLFPPRGDTLLLQHFIQGVKNFPVLPCHKTSEFKLEYYPESFKEMKIELQTMNHSFTTTILSPSRFDYY